MLAIRLNEDLKIIVDFGNYFLNKKSPHATKETTTIIKTLKTNNKQQSLTPL